jgi:hypothetical protein
MPKFLQLYDLLPQYVRRADADQTFHSVFTTLGTSVVAGAVQAVTPANVTGIRPHLSLTVEPGLFGQEVVEVLSVTPPSFTAFFNIAHPATATVTDAVLPPLKALLSAAQTQGDLVYADIQRLWNNFFVETCDDWVLPYIADLIALNLIDDDPANNRREVARTIAYRRRKGTVPQLETMAYDVTGYGARVVEFFERMLWNQCMFHFKFNDLHTADVRDASALARIGHAFDRTSHTADLRPSTQGHGWYNIRKLGFFFWRLQAIPLKAVEPQPAPAPAPAGAYHFNVLGQPEPLFQYADPPEHGADKDWPRATELSVMSPISRRLFLESPDWFWGTQSGFNIYINGAPTGLSVLPADLCSWTAPQQRQGQIAVDVRLGRFLFHPKDVPAAGQTVTVDYSFGFSGNIGGGGYPRKGNLRPQDGETADLVHVSKSSGPVTSIAAALTQLAGSAASLRVVHIDDSRTYQENLTLPPSFDTLVIQANDGQRPTLLLSNAVNVFSGLTNGSQLILSGLLITGAGQTLTLPTGVKSFLLQDCTVDPGGGRAADGVSSRLAGVRLKAATPATASCLRLDRTIVGQLDLPGDMNCLAIADSVADATAFQSKEILKAGPPSSVLRSTLLGSFECHNLEASLSIFAGATTALFRQQGCVRFCYFAPGSLVPRRYECAPDSPSPVFTSQFFSDPGYTQLAVDCLDLAVPGACSGSAIVLGENGQEMGVWSSLGNVRRLNHLRLRLSEYLPAGLTPVFVFES